MRDASGNPVTGQVSVNVSGADASTSAVTAILPEGLNASGAANVEQAVGVANVLVNSATGSKVKQFSNPITVTTSIPATTTLNGVPIKTGDTLSSSLIMKIPVYGLQSLPKPRLGALMLRPIPIQGLFKLTI